MAARKTGVYRYVEELLDALRARRCSRAKVTLDGDRVTGLEVEFSPDPEPAAPFVDRKGRPINLDEGAPPLARDPDGELEDEQDPDVSSDREIERANLARRDEKAS